MMIHLRPMTESEYADFTEITNKTYAEEKVKAGAWKPEEAFRLSQEAHQRLLPEGPQTKNNYVLSIVNADSAGQDLTVGFLWFAVDEHSPVLTAFIYQFAIFEPYRRRHFGTQAFQALEIFVQPLGIKSIALHVFAHNRAAWSLYEKLGYELTDINMVKKLP